MAHDEAPQSQPSYAAACDAGQGCANDGGCAQGCATGCGPCLQVFGDLLYLRPRNAGLEYAVPINGPIAPGAGAHPGRSHGLAESAIRAGLPRRRRPGIRPAAPFRPPSRTMKTASTTRLPPTLLSCFARWSCTRPRWMRSADWLNASAHQYMRFNLGDVDYRHVFYCNDYSSVNYLVGIRYANLKQTFTSQFESIIRENVDTDVNFDGAGIPPRSGRRAHFRLVQPIRLRQGFGELPGRRIPRQLPAKQRQQPADCPNRLERSPPRLHARLRSGPGLDAAATGTCGPRPATWSAAG